MAIAVQSSGTSLAETSATNFISNNSIYVAGDENGCLVVVVAWSGVGVNPTSVQFDDGGGGVEMVDVFGTTYSMTSFSFYRIYTYNNPPSSGPSYTVNVTFDGNFENAALHCVVLSGTDISMSGVSPLDTPTGPTVSVSPTDTIIGSEPSGSTAGIFVWGWSYSYDPNPAPSYLACDNANNTTNDLLADTNDPGYPVTLWCGTFTRLDPPFPIGVVSLTVQSFDSGSSFQTVDGLGVHSFNIRPYPDAPPASPKLTQTILIM